MQKHPWLYILFAIVTGACSPKTETNTSKTELVSSSYSNPILHLDYSDPDVVKVGQKYYMTASSFNCVPGLPLLESDNLIDWELVGYALPRLEPEEVFQNPQHGKGVWAPAIRYHNEQFYIYYGDPDFGIYMLTAPDIRGPWTKPHLVQAGKGWIDPCPFWDENGEAWLVHAWAGSRAGVKSTLTLHRMSADGKELLDQGRIIFDGHAGNRTVEGPKMYKRQGYYYIFAPAGGVEFGWQLALRSKNITGPYEVKKVLAQGNTNINGPHQGAWVSGLDQSDWFFHFQDKGAFGRVVHLQPLIWQNDWPVMGSDADNDGCGEPVEKFNIQVPANSQKQTAKSYSDEFNTDALNVHWQWHANPDAQWGAPSGYLGYLRLNAVPREEKSNLWDIPNLLLQKFPAQKFQLKAKLDFFLHENGDCAGLVLMGQDYAWLGMERKQDQNYLVYKTCRNADKGSSEKTIETLPIADTTLYLQVTVDEVGTCRFAWAGADEQYQVLHTTFKARTGRWIGAKAGLFCISTQRTNDAGYVNADWFRVQTIPTKN